jgi:hypothetical protein
MGKKLSPPATPAMQGRIWYQHQTFNRWLKSGEYLCRSITMTSLLWLMVNGTVFHECLVIRQLSMVNGEPLVKVEYRDKLHTVVYV